MNDWFSGIQASEWAWIATDRIKLNPCEKSPRLLKVQKYFKFNYYVSVLVFVSNCDFEAWWGYR